ncbi:hypothetical protein PFICI_12734 [Pestalotiopsis fici W106-1]|uniref:DUF676 domain-containing protein n=1 Tax=Pestalotiopsis fici (strain W106-1 / CGMCC3.15140) TaxID=1229662 RepID=W3WPH2_PESFW|nr:uncharacterized protein PFICI_12734 [Pestalotiopsis fici W106-1]ETS75790.1 hypothetical protein PFICI_12734 [Pestalotiopsis fici W106-1]
MDTPKEPYTGSSLDVPQKLGHQGLDADVSNMLAMDPRLSSTQSLTPSIIDTRQGPRRRLLIIYIHGFIGNDDSFHSFPVHVHRYLRQKLASTHAIHSKIYPRYKTYKAFHLARDNFSEWLALHESPSTDVVLVGHSMGGLLAADVVLMKKPSPDGGYCRKHRILGTVNMDVPFYGVQNSVILTGILSPFRPKPRPGDMSDVIRLHQSTSQIFKPQSPEGSPTASLTQQRSTSSLRNFYLKGSSTLDPNYNPHFSNDLRIMDRGWWKNIEHFVKKHRAEGLLHAGFRHLKAHFEFGSCLLDSQRLRLRYKQLRKLEDAGPSGVINESLQPSTDSERCRFIQFYTVCHKGRAPSTSAADNFSIHSKASRQTGSTDISHIPHYGVTEQNDGMPENSCSPMPETPRKELLFCKLAREEDGQIDRLWKRVTMATTDEISAHTMLFMPGPHYGDLVDRVGEIVAQWILEITP